MVISYKQGIRVRKFYPSNILTKRVNKIYGLEIRHFVFKNNEIFFRDSVLSLVKTFFHECCEKNHEISLLHKYNVIRTKSKYEKKLVVTYRSENISDIHGSAGRLGNRGQLATLQRGHFPDSLATICASGPEISGNS